jgi:hypothetical protein
MSLRLGLLLLFAATPALATAPGFNIIKTKPLPSATPGQPTAPGQSTPPADDVGELMKNRAQFQQAYEGLNTNNPISADFNPGAVTGATGPLAQMQKMLSNPMVQGYLRIFQNPALLETVQKIGSHPNRMTLLYSEIAFIIFIFIFRAWRQSKAQHWARKLWVSFYVFLLAAGGASFGLPALIIGDPYIEMWKTMYSSAFQKQ